MPLFCAVFPGCLGYIPGAWAAVFFVAQVDMMDGGAGVVPGTRCRVAILAVFCWPDRGGWQPIPIEGIDPAGVCRWAEYPVPLWGMLI